MSWVELREFCASPLSMFELWLLMLIQMKAIVHEWLESTTFFVVVVAQKCSAYINKCSTWCSYHLFLFSYLKILLFFCISTLKTIPWIDRHFTPKVFCILKWIKSNCRMYRLLWPIKVNILHLKYIEKSLVKWMCVCFMYLI